jgi:hypothetical protein
MRVARPLLKEKEPMPRSPHLREMRTLDEYAPMLIEATDRMHSRSFGRSRGAELVRGQRARSWVVALSVGTVMSACGVDTVEASGNEDGCAVAMVTDYAPSPDVVSGTPKAAIEAWMAATRKDLLASTALYGNEREADRAHVADLATLDALKSAETVAAAHAPKEESGTTPRTARLSGSDPAGRSVTITVTRGAAGSSSLWMVTGYEIDRDDAWCPRLPKKSA